MRKLVLLATVLATVVLLTAVPGVAQVSQETEKGAESDAAVRDSPILEGGDGVDRCAGLLGAAQTGNAANNAGTLRSNGDGEEVEANDGGSFAVSPALAERCEQEINQTAVAASSRAEATKTRAPPKAAPKSAPKAAPKGEAKAVTPMEGKPAQAKAGSKAGEKKELPKTGGFEPFVLVVGASTSAVGLLARSFYRRRRRRKPGRR